MRILLILLGCFLFMHLDAQLMYTKEGIVQFESVAPLETIHAVNNNGSSVIDLESGNVEFAVLIKAFKFKKALMEQHFNENYMESSKFPKAVFKGTVPEIKKIDISNSANQSLSANGKLTIHGVTRDTEVIIAFETGNGSLKANTTFDVKVDDYDIKIPKLVIDNIAKSIKITVDANYQPFE